MPSDSLTNSTNNTPAAPVFGLLPVTITLELIDEHRGSAVVAHSALLVGKRVIAVKLCRSHELVARSLANADLLVIRFLVGIALTEYVLFWGQTSDGAAVREALKRLAGIAASDRAWGTQFASRLAAAEQMRAVDSLPIYGADPHRGQFPLFGFETMMKSPSDIIKWRGKGERAKPAAKPSKGLPQWAGPVEMPEPLESPPVRSSSLSGPVAVVEPSPRALRRQEQRVAAAGGSSGATSEVVAKPDSFLAGFYAAAKEMLPPADVAVLEAMVKEMGDV